VSRPSERFDLSARLDQLIGVRTAFSRSINLVRDSESPDLVRSYMLTSRAIQVLEQILPGLAGEAYNRAFALIGPYGSGKSAFGLFLSALLSAPESRMRQTALATLHCAHPRLAEQIRDAVRAPRGFLRIAVNGTPDSLVRQLMLVVRMVQDGSGRLLPRVTAPDAFLKGS
jgi:hypothetical protein